MVYGHCGCVPFANTEDLKPRRKLGYITNANNLNIFSFCMLRMIVLSRVMQQKSLLVCYLPMKSRRRRKKFGSGRNTHTLSTHVPTLFVAPHRHRLPALTGVLLRLSKSVSKNQTRSRIVWRTACRESIFYCIPR